eukprot:scaffold117968_cov57-Phaeocystis_antarctica.AAC.1
MVSAVATTASAEEARRSKDEISGDEISGDEVATSSGHAGTVSSCSVSSPEISALGSLQRRSSSGQLTWLRPEVPTGGSSSAFGASASCSETMRDCLKLRAPELLAPPLLASPISSSTALPRTRRAMASASASGASLLQLC